MKGPKDAGTIAKDRDSVVGQAGRAARPPKKGQTPKDEPRRLRTSRRAAKARSREGRKAPQERPDPERRTTKVANQQPGGKGREGRKVKSLKIN